MSKYNKTQAPYNDYGESELAKQYYQLLAVPGRVAQAREFSTMQTILQGIIKSIGDSIMSNGDIVEGCQVITSTDKKSVTVTSGKIYIDGIVTPLEETVVPIKGVGTEVIGVKINEYIVTETDDNTLRDPSQGYDNYSQAGCNRIKRSLEVVVDDTNSSPIATLQDGDLTIENNGPNYDTIEQILARRTYDESGSYIVNGLSVHLENRDGANSDTYNVVVESGKAYVLGYELKIPTARRLQNTRSNTTSKVSVGNYSYGTTTTLKEQAESGNDFIIVNSISRISVGSKIHIGSDYSANVISVDRDANKITLSEILPSTFIVLTPVLVDIDTYQLDSNPYVQSISMLKGIVQTSEQQVLTTNTDSILLNMVDVVNLVSVNQGDTHYTIGDTSSDGDCYLLRDGTRYYVKWNGKTTPSSGQSYTVTYTYNKVFEQGKDYELEIDQNGSGSYLNFLDGGDTPMNGTNFDIEYYQYLARRDLVYLDQYGKFTIIHGAPDEDGFEVSPIAPVNTLAIAQIYNPPNGQANSTIQSLNVTVDNIGLTRFTMNDIQNIVDRVKKTEYNQAVLTLNEDARNRYTVNSKKGILTDPIVDFSRIDIYYNLKDGKPIDPLKPVYNMALDFDLGYAYLPVNVDAYDVSSVSANSTGRYGRLVTLKPTGENVVLSQPNATKSFLVNPYSVFPQLPDVLVTPAIDSWVENTVVEVPVSLTNSKLVNTTTNILYNTTSRTVVQGGRFKSYTTSSTSSSSVSNETRVGTEVANTVTESVVSEKAITYMRQKTLTVEGKNFAPGLDNIRCLFDGIEVPLTPASGTSSGNEPGSLKADENGYVKGTFMVPKNVRTGVREVELFSDTVVDGYQSSGYALYQSTGTTRTIQRTLTTVTTVLLQKNITTTVSTKYVTYVDPVGQTFVLDRDTVLKGVDVYFESKPETNHTIILEVRNVVNGTIGSTIYASKTLNATQVSVSNNASVPTRFNFDDPCVLENNTEYAFTLRSVSDRYRIWVSEIGGTDVLSKEVILKNSYLSGVMMSSSNNSSWTIHQTTDIKFKLIEDVYDNKGSITFSPISVNDCTRLDLIADYVELEGTSVKWYYSTNGGVTFHSITPGSLRELDSIANEVILKVDLSRTSTENITPFLAFDSLQLIGSSYMLSGDYIGISVVGIEKYENVNLIMNTQIPAGTTIVPYFSYDNGDTLVELIADDSQTKPLNNGWREMLYTGSIPDGAIGTQFKLFIKATTNSPMNTPKFSSIKTIMD